MRCSNRSRGTDRPGGIDIRYTDLITSPFRRLLFSSDRCILSRVGHPLFLSCGTAIKQTMKFKIHHINSHPYLFLFYDPVTVLNRLPFRLGSRLFSLPSSLKPHFGILFFLSVECLWQFLSGLLTDKQTQKDFSCFFRIGIINNDTSTEASFLGYRCDELDLVVG